jgi:hypothetical protein
LSGAVPRDDGSLRHGGSAAGLACDDLGEALLEGRADP